MIINPCALPLGSITFLTLTAGGKRLFFSCKYEESVRVFSIYRHVYHHIYFYSLPLVALLVLNTVNRAGKSL